MILMLKWLFYPSQAFRNDQKTEGKYFQLQQYFKEVINLWNQEFVIATVA